MRAAFPAQIAGSDRPEHDFRGDASPCRTPSRRVSSGRIGTAHLVDDAPGIGPGDHLSAAWRRSRSRRAAPPSSIGARPRYFGSSEPCMLNAPAARSASIAGGSMWR